MDTVLVVEDSRPMQRTLQRLFEADGLQVQIASDGVEGLESFRKQAPSIVVLDLKLPHLPGKELCRAFKAQLPTVPIVVLSANAEVEDLQSRITENISDSLQYSSLYWSDHLCSTPDNHDRRVWESLKKFFEGLFPLFWIEVLSIMGMVPMGARSIRRVISWAKVSPATAYIQGNSDWL